MKYTKEEIIKWITWARETKFSLSKIGYALTAIAEMMYNAMAKEESNEMGEPK